MDTLLIKQKHRRVLLQNRVINNEVTDRVICGEFGRYVDRSYSYDAACYLVFCFIK